MRPNSGQTCLHEAMSTALVMAAGLEHAMLASESNDPLSSGYFRSAAGRAEIMTWFFFFLFLFGYQDMIIMHNNTRGMSDILTQATTETHALWPSRACRRSE